MKTDLSFLLYIKYFKLENREVEITLKNQTVLKGVFTGFCKGDVEAGEPPYILKWHLTDTSTKTSFEMDVLGGLTGTIIKQNTIAEIKFLDDHSVMKFNNK